MGYISELRALVGHRPLIQACAGALILEEEGLDLQYFAFDELPAALNPADRPILQEFVRHRAGGDTP